MLDLVGKYNTAKVFTDNIDSETISQIIELLNQEFIKDSQVRIMPDCHAGKGCVVGTTITLTDKVVPNLCGVDIGCGMYAIKLEETNIDLKLLDEVINTYIPAGFNIHNRVMAKYPELKQYACKIDRENARKSLGTLGGGNHFIEVDKDRDGALWLVIHTGSRHLGIEVCNFYQKAGYAAIKEIDINKKIEKTIADLKARGLEREIENTIKVFKTQAAHVPEHLAYVEGQLFEDYIHDMRLTQGYAKLNRQTIADIILSKAKLHPLESFDTIHNYIDIDNMILRKGSISAQLGEKVIIPMNMKDGSLICIGEGNPDWNYSAPHGAGRIMSRGQAKANVDFNEFKKSMEGIYSTSVVRSTIDEAPQVYKPMDEIIENIKDTVEITDIIKPIYNFKAHEKEKIKELEEDLER